MLAPPDPLRQRCIDLSQVMQTGYTLFQSFTWAFFDDRYRDRSAAAYQGFMTWYDAVLAVLNEDERLGFERIRAKAIDPTWDETWEIALGHRPHPGESNGYKRDLYNTRLTRYMEEMLDYLTTLRLHLFPPSPLPESLRTLIADRFHKLTNYTIDAFFIENGCLIDWRILPLKPTGKKSADRVLGWIDGLVLHRPDDMVQRLQAAYQAFRQHKSFPPHLPRDDIQVELAALLQPASSTLLVAYHFHPMVEQIATPFWGIGEYDTALLKVCIALDTAVQAKSGKRDSGASLMRTVFSRNTPILKIDSRFGNQGGFMDLFAGVMDAIRNPRAHHHQSQLSREEALEWLAFLSALFRVLDATTL
jgi:uncharacterized protein (TIGR02391 family)